MADGLAIPPNTLSFHLKELAHAGLVTQERASRNIIYRAAFDHMNALLGYLTENCCRGAECVVDERCSVLPAAEPLNPENAMKRFHVHAHVDDLQASIAFYSQAVRVPSHRASRADYAKWMLDDPRVNFAISTRGGKPGVDHLGFQTDTAESSPS